MRTFNKTQEDRKILVNRIGELTGKKLTYTKVPRCAYEGNGFTVTKEGNLEVDDSADATVIETLITEGLIENSERPEAPTLTVSLPVSRHDGATLRNLINLIFTRAKLLNKALGTSFWVEEGLTDFLRDETGLLTAEDLRKAVAAYEEKHGQAISGLVIEPEKIIFSGLPATDNPIALKTFANLCTMMNKQALTQNRIQAKTVDEKNEKYALRIWLVRLGMNGPEYKDDRKFLMENLSGHCAFRTDDERTRWLEKQEQKRQKLNAIKAAMEKNDVVSE